jgi:AcrR family transcriptional regulator
MSAKKKITTRQINALKTKNALTESAKSLFAEKGYDSVTIEEITSRAGISKGSFYTYYKSKSHIILEIYRKADKRYEKIYNRLPNNLSATNKLRTFIREVFKYSERNTRVEFEKVVYQSQLNYEEEKELITGKNRPYFTIIEDIINEGQKNGEFRTDFSSSVLTAMVVSTMRGTFYDWCLNDGIFALAERGTACLSILIDGIRNQEI